MNKQKLTNSRTRRRQRRSFYNNEVKMIRIIKTAFILHIVDASLFERKSFTWRANLNGLTGVATSFEQSVFQPKNNDDIVHPSTNTKVQKIVQDIFSQYPIYLGSPSLTLGLCRSVDSSTTSHVMNENEESYCNLQTSLFHFNMLSFGKPRLKSNKKIRSTIVDNVCRFSVDTDTTIIKDGEIICCVEIPIVGGLLANVDDSISTGSNEDHGCLRFTWLQTQPNNYQHTSKIIILTEIAGRYQPKLAGTKLPISKLHNILYCSTQRMLHVYVMWRYHDHVVKEYRRRLFNVKGGLSRSISLIQQNAAS